MRQTNKVYGVSNEVIDTYIERPKVDKLFTEGLQKNKSSDEVPLYIPYYFIKILLNESFENIIPGLRRRVIQEKIKEIHHRPESVRPSDMGYFLTSLVPNQIKQGISPPLFDYDNGTSTVKVIDSTFYFFLKNCDKEEVIENLTIPQGIEE